MIREEFVVSGVKYQLFAMRVMKDICTLISCSVSSYSSATVQAFDRAKVNWELQLADCAELCSGLDIDLEGSPYILSPHSIAAENLTMTVSGASVNIKISAFEKNMLSSKASKEIGRLHLIYANLKVLSRKAHQLSRAMADSLRKIVADNNIRLSCSVSHSVLEDFVKFTEQYSNQCLGMESDNKPTSLALIDLLLSQLYYLRGSLDAKYEQQSVETLNKFAVQLVTISDSEFREYTAFINKLCSKAMSCSLKASCQPLYLDMMYRFCCFHLEQI